MARWVSGTAIDLSTTFDCYDVHHLGGAIDAEDDAPAANARFPKSSLTGERPGRASVERIFCELLQPSNHALLGVAAETVQFAGGARSKRLR